MNIYFRIRLWFKKRYALQEVRTDIKYIETHKFDILSFNEKDARTKLSQERSKDEAASEAVMNNLSRQIGAHVALKKEYGDLKQLESEISEYLKLIWTLL